MYKILSVNGGGIRGYISAFVLQELDSLLDGHLRDHFDLIVGNSAGAFIGAALDHLPLGHINNLISNTLPSRMFKPNWFSFGGFFNTLYDTDKKNGIIKEILQDDCQNINYAFISYDLLTRRPVIFNNLEDIDNKCYKFTTKYKIKDAVCASTSAPIYWHPYYLDNMLLVDGVYAINDPTIVGVKLALDKGRSLKDLLIVNIGTGISTRRYDLKTGNCPAKWMIPTMNMLMSSQAQISNMLFSEEDVAYYSFDTPLDIASDDIDDVSRINLINLEKEASRLIQKEYNKLLEVAELLG